MSKKSTRGKNKRLSKGDKKPVHRGLTNVLIEEFKYFIEYHPTERFIRNLRKMLIEFLLYDGATEAVYLNDLLFDLEGLFHLLDEIQNNKKGTT
jgi:hypothetical protein